MLLCSILSIILVTPLIRGQDAADQGAQGQNDQDPRLAGPNVEVDGWIYDHTVPPAPGANPQGSIRCHGSRSPLLDGLIPNGPSISGIRSILEYCAEPDYGGRLHEVWNDPQLPGAACAWFLDPPRVVISKKWATSGADRDWKRWHLCEMKCSCMEGWPSRQRARAIASSNQATLLLQDQSRLGTSRTHTYTIGPPTDLHYTLPGGPQVGTPHHRIPIYHTTNGLSREPNPRKEILRTQMIFGLDYNKMVCQRSIPPWPLPLNRPYRTLNEVCAPNFLAGNPDGNAGVICFDPDGNQMNRVDVLAHPLYTTAISMSTFQTLADPQLGRDITAAVAIQLYCLSNCACKLPDPSTRRPNSASNKTPWGDTSMVGDNWVLDGKVPETGRTFRWTLIERGEPTYGNGGMRWTSRGCVPLHEGSEYCANPPPPEAQYVLKGLFGGHKALNVPAKPDASTCGATCKGPADCPSVDGVQGCHCVADSKSVVTSQTYDPVLGNLLQYTFRASCLALGASLAQHKGLGLGGKRKEKREDGTGLWEQGVTERPLCVCNATYVSTGCCGSVDGLIWEDHGASPKRNWVLQGETRESNHFE